MGRSWATKLNRMPSEGNRECASHVWVFFRMTPSVQRSRRSLRTLICTRMNAPPYTHPLACQFWCRFENLLYGLRCIKSFHIQSVTVSFVEIQFTQKNHLNYFFGEQLNHRIYRSKKYSSIWWTPNCVRRRTEHWNKIKMEFWSTYFLSMKTKMKNWSGWNWFIPNRWKKLSTTKSINFAPSLLRKKVLNRKMILPIHRKSKQIMTRNAFEKHFFPENLNLKDCVEHLPVPPNAVSTPIKLTKCTISGPTIFVAGRYRKLSRELSQSPWILGGKRVMDESVQEIIAREIAPYFSVDPVTQVEQINFMSSGREDIDVRCLGKGRPFVLELVNSKKSSLSPKISAGMELAVDRSKKVSVQHLQLVKRLVICSRAVSRWALRTNKSVFVISEKNWCT